MKIFIEAVSQISIQEPLQESWFQQPTIPCRIINQSIEPDYRQYVTPIEARRMGKLLKRAVATALHTIRTSGCSNPDAIIVGTGLGCVAHTDHFLDAMIDNEEEYLSPTSFMQSTHNTISSQIALRLRCHNYNCTHSNGGSSFENALLDAVIHFELGKTRTALVGGYEEMTDATTAMLRRIGQWKQPADNLQQSLYDADTSGSISGECAVCMLLNQVVTERTVCALDGMTLLHQPTPNQFRESLNKLLIDNHLQINEIDGIVCGVSGDAANDAIYRENAATFFNGRPLIWYKHLFGESYCAPAFGVYAAATCLKNGAVPAHLMYQPKGTSVAKPQHLLVYNHFQNQNHSLILLSCCN